MGAIRARCASTRLNRSNRSRALLLIAVAAALLSVFATGQALAQQAIGRVSRIQGEASATHAGTTRALGLRAPVLLDDVVLTGEAARLELIFSDNTRLTLGEKTKLTIERYIFNPAAAMGIMKVEVIGALRFVSGRLSKLAHADVSVTTPVASVGIRGTDFWVGPIDNQALGVLLMEGAVSVTNAAGEQILNQPGQGTNIATPGAAPGPVTLWPADKVSRALAAVAFR